MGTTTIKPPQVRLHAIGPNIKGPQTLTGRGLFVYGWGGIRGAALSLGKPGWSRIRSVTGLAAIFVILILACSGGGGTATSTAPLPTQINPTETPTTVPTPASTPTTVIPKQDTIILVFGEEPENLGVYGDPGCPFTPAHFPCLDGMSDPLAYIDNDTLEVVPLSGVESWEQISENRWRFTLREDVTFHNGEPWNAEAAAKGITWMGDVEHGQDSFSYTGASHGEVFSEMQVEAICDEPCPIYPRTAFLVNFQAPDWFAFATEGERASTTVGFGPYKLARWNRGQKLLLEINENYLPNDSQDARLPSISEVEVVWSGDPGVRAAMAAVGEVDWAIDVGLDQQDVMPVFTQGSVAETFVTIWDSIWHPELRKILVRQALAYATDCQEMVDSLYDGFYECHGNPAPPGTLGLTPENSAPFPYDPDLAVQLLDEAGYDDSNEIVISVLDGGFFNNTQVAESQVRFFQDVGVNARVQVLEFATWLQIANTGCGNAIAEFADDPPEDYCLGFPPGPPTFESPQGYQLNPANEALDFGRTATTFMNCEFPSSNACDPANIQPLIGPALAATGEDRQEQMEELADIIHDEQFIYTYFNAEVFYGISEDLEWTPRFDGRLRVNTMSFR